MFCEMWRCFAVPRGEICYNMRMDEKVEKMGKQGFMLRVLQGFLIGAVGVVPGASGGVIAVSMGLYEPCVEAAYDFLRSFRTKGKASFLFLLPLVIGGSLGLFGCSFGLEWLLDNLYEPFMFTLIGMVLGGLPAFFTEANQGGFKARYLLPAFLGFALILIPGLLEKNITGGVGLPFNIPGAMLSGALIVAGTMLPGMSTSFLLMLLGLYKPTLAALTGLQWGNLFFVGLGGVCGGLLMLSFVRKMFRRFHGYAYYTMLGFLAATVVLIFPGMHDAPLWDVPLLAAGFVLSWLMTRKSKKDPLARDVN